MDADDRTLCGVLIGICGGGGFAGIAALCVTFHTPAPLCLALPLFLLAPVAAVNVAKR